MTDITFESVSWCTEFATVSAVTPFESGNARLELSFFQNPSTTPQSMPLIKSVSENKKAITFIFSDILDGRQYGVFKESFANTARPGMTYKIDLSKVGKMDSSALSLLITLKDYARANSALVEINNPSKVARKILEKSFFHKFFDINYS